MIPVKSPPATLTVAIFCCGMCLCASFFCPIDSAQACSTNLVDDESESLAALVKIIDQSSDPAVQAALLRGMLSGFEGRRRVPAPKGWSELAEKLSKSENADVTELTTQLSQIFGDAKAVEKTLAVLRDEKASTSERRKALNSLLAQQNKDASAYLEKLLGHSELRLDAIRGYALVENAKGPAILLEKFKRFDSAHQRAVIETLAARKSYAQVLLKAIQEKKISREDIPVPVARSLSQILGDPFVAVYGKVKSIGADREKQIAKYKKLITPTSLEKADASRGRAIFKKTCAACHTLYGEGGKVGPDLTGSNRANLDYILLNSVDPSFDVPDGYKAEMIATVDGLLITGVIAEEDGTRVVLKTAEQPRVVVAIDDIESRKTSDKSIMPDGQLDELKPQQVVDLIKYLRTTEQVELAE